MLIVSAMRTGFLVLCLLVLSGCAQTSHLRLKLMPTPLVYQADSTKGLLKTAVPQNAPYEGVLYVTDRKPVAMENRIDKLREYSKERHDFLSAGLNKVVYNRHGKKELSVAAVERFGSLSSIPLFGPLTDNSRFSQLKSADQAFADLVNKKLSVSEQQDIFVYVHGAHDSFENPALVAGELWHHLGYEGVLLNFLWPSTRARFGYFKDVENAQASGTSLRLLLSYLATKTSARKIHLVSHSAGGRVVIQALYEMALANTRLEDSRVGEVLLIASDYSAPLMGIALSEGMAGQAEQITIYVSQQDTALSVSRFFFKLQRLGQLEENIVADESVTRFFDDNGVTVIDVTGADKTREQHGHSYFRSSPWVSSDVIATLRLGLKPSQRGLVRKPSSLPWSFPKQYPEALETALSSQ